MFTSQLAQFHNTEILKHMQSNANIPEEHFNNRFHCVSLEAVLRGTCYEFFKQLLSQDLLINIIYVYLSDWSLSKEIMVKMKEKNGVRNSTLARMLWTLYQDMVSKILVIVLHRRFIHLILKYNIPCTLSCPCQSHKSQTMYIYSRPLITLARGVLNTCERE